MMNYIFTRLNEASTWRGMVALLMSLGISLNPEQQAAFLTLGLAIIGGIGAFFGDKFKKPAA